MFNRSQKTLIGLNDLAAKIFENNKRKGFHNLDVKPNVGERLMLVVSELGEALEADRTGKKCDPVQLAWFYSTTDESHALDEHFPEHIKNTFEDEIADSIIRLLDTAALLGIDIEGHILAKLCYNQTRPYKHGKQY